MSGGLAAWCLLHVLIAALGTCLARRYALSTQLLDQPGERRSHAHATPRGGGIAIVVSMLVAFGLLLIWVPYLAPAWLFAGIGLLLVSAVGWIDDHRPLSPWLRLAVHAIAASMLGVTVLLNGGGWWSASIAFAAGTILINVWNFMDGINGLATTQAALVAAALALLAVNIEARWLAWALVAACLGFLPFNFPKARIFLGDVGSGALGYLIAVLLAFKIDGTAKDLLLVLPLSAFLIDATLTLGKRMVSGDRWWEPHVTHLYQRLARSRSHARVTVLYAAWTLVAAMAMWAIQSARPAFIIASVLCWVLAGVGGWFFAGRRTRGV